MELVVDDRERAVIIHLSKILKIKVERITVGDYAFVYKEKVIVIVERKSLADLASSIKDGRMENNNKLLDAQKKHGCQILYIVEGSAYPNLERRIGRMPYKCLQGKLDSLLFRHNIKIIWTKDCEHTAKRLAGLSATFTKFAKDGLYGEFKDVEGGANNADKINNVIKPKHKVNLDQVHLQMLTKLSGVSYKTAMAALQHYTVFQLLTGQTDATKCYNMVYLDSGFRLGPRGTKMHNICERLHMLDDVQQKILSCVNGITVNTAGRILESVSFNDLVMLKFPDGKIANIQKSEKRKMGEALEARIKLTFQQAAETHVEKLPTQLLPAIDHNKPLAPTPIITPSRGPTPIEELIKPNATINIK
jgi:ERCC4-type nuclease